MKKHYFQYIEDVIKQKWNTLSLCDYGEQQQYTYGELAEQIERLHIRFRLLGLQKGDKIAICGRNCANWAVAYLAIQTYGGVVVSILQDFTADDITNLLVHSDSKMLFVGAYVWRDLQKKDLPMLETIISLTDWAYLKNTDKAPTEADVEAAYSQKFPNGLQPADVHYDVDPDVLSLINYTSGSTGSPKGVMLNGRSLSNNVEIGMHLLPTKVGSKVVSMLPLAHMFGQVCEFLYPFCSGARIYFLTKSPTPTILLKALKEVQPYLVVTVPLVIEKIHKKNLDPLLSKKVLKVLWDAPFIKDIIRNHVRVSLKKAFGGNIKYFLCGGAAMSADVEKCLMDIRFPLSIGYGMTECGPLIGGNHPKNFKARSVGVPVLNMEVKIDEPNEEGIGEILVRGENVMLGYYKNEQATRLAFTEDGWMRTGDLGYLDKGNNIYIKGRNKTMILGASGQNIYPEEIEHKLNKQEGVEESIIVEREGKLVGLVFPDEQTSSAFSWDEIMYLMKENLLKLNKLLPGYSQVSQIEVKKEPFEKTPKNSIKRFLYK